MSGKLSHSCCEGEKGGDRITELPDDIINLILSKLPLKDTGKTSLLSKEWRYKWQIVSSLKFDRGFQRLHGGERLEARKFADYVNHILLLHSGQISKFRLSDPFYGRLPHTDVNKWMLHISRHPIKEFKLKVINSDEYYYDLTCLFSGVQNLTHLYLSQCLLNPPSTFKGFKDLKSLTLRQVCLEQHVFEILVSSCKLEKLTLSGHFGLNCLRINAPNLQSLKFKSDVAKLVIENAHCLAKLYISNFFGEYLNSDDLLKLFADVPQLESLRLYTYCCEFLDIPRALPLPFLKLRCMSMTVNFSDLKWTSMLLCLLRSSPNLQELVICPIGVSDKLSIAICQTDQWNIPFTLLQNFTIDSFCGVQANIDFVRFVLLSSPVLKKLTVRYQNGIERREFVKQIESLKCASSRVQIIFKD